MDNRRNYMLRKIFDRIKEQNPHLASRTSFSRYEYMQLVKKYISVEDRLYPGVHLNENERVETTFLVIDFETANWHKTSACQIGLVLVRNGVIIEEYESLIKPEPFYFNPGHIRVHGITEETVEHAPYFDEIWSNILNLINQADIVIAHNAPFDMGILKALLRLYNISCPKFKYACSYQMLRSHYFYLSYKLNYLAEANNINFKHHDALEDVKATAYLIILHFAKGNSILNNSNLQNIKKTFDVVY